MNLFKTLRHHILSTLEQLAKAEGWPENLPLAAITVELPRDASHGDASTNAAMVLAKPLGKNPREVAEKIIQAVTESLQSEQVRGGEAVGFGAAFAPKEIKIAGPGFINFRLEPAFWQQLLPLPENYGASDLGRGKKVNVEYVSANPTGPMHIGHARGAVVGDAIARLLAFAGYEVTKEYYINDAGAQVDTLARSAHLRYREVLGEAIGALPEGMYPGEYLKDVGRALAAVFGDAFRNKPEAEWLMPVRDFTLAAMMQNIREDLALLGVQHDVFTSEKSLSDSGAVQKAVAELQKRGLIYRGILEPPKGKTPEDWEPVEQTLFRSTQFGDDVDRPVFRSDGSLTYFASDIAYMQHKLDRGFTRLVMELGADHGGYVKRMKAVCAAFSEGAVPLDIILHQMVNLLDGGEPLKMSKRAGRVVSVRDVVEEVGAGVLRFIMLTRKAEAVLDFDLQKVMEQSKDNPVFYVQYAHARCRSILRKEPEGLPEADLALLSHEAEIALLKKIALWPVAVEQAALACEPHRIAYYLEEVAAELHGFWNLGNENEGLRFIVADERLTAARLALVGAVAAVIASGLNVLGVEPVEEMR